MTCGDFGCNGKDADHTESICKRCPSLDFNCRAVTSDDLGFDLESRRFECQGDRSHGVQLGKSVTTLRHERSAYANPPALPSQYKNLRGTYMSRPVSSIEVPAYRHGQGYGEGEGLPGFNCFFLTGGKNRSSESTLRGGTADDLIAAMICREGPQRQV
jgi:hypothetical protein